jgi:hypothetical protein
MVSYVKGLAYDSQGQPYLDIELIPGISMTATSTKLDLSGLLPGDLTDAELASLEANGLFDPLGRILIDMIGPGDAPSVEGPHHTTQMNISMLTYIQVDNTSMNSMLVHELPLDAVGDLSFSPDGLMVVDISGKSTMKMVLHIPLINIDIPLPLPTDVNMRAISRNPLSWWNAF